jgi:hypothetical protein
MSKSGDVVCLPFDLRVPFARSEKYHYIKVARPVLKSM